MEWCERRAVVLIFGVWVAGCQAPASFEIDLEGPPPVVTQQVVLAADTPAPPDAHSPANTPPASDAHADADASPASDTQTPADTPPASDAQTPADTPPASDVHADADSAQTTPSSPPVTVHAALSHAYYNESQPEHLVLEVDLSAIATDAKVRRPINVALLFDRSGSMADENKFHFAMRAANLVVENLSDRDIVSLVVFNDVATVLSPAGRTVNKEFLHYRFSQFQPAGYTNLSAGLLEAFAQIDSMAKPEQLKQVVLLTDGLANRGITNHEQLKQLVELAHKRGIGISTLGCGTKFDGDLMNDLALAGGGRYTCARLPDQIPAAIASELHGLISVAAQNGTLEVRATNGSKISRIYGRLIDQPLAAYTFHLGDLRDGDRNVILMDITPPALATGTTAAVDLTLTVDDPKTATRQTQTQHLSATFSANAQAIHDSVNDTVTTYADVLNAMDKTQDAIQTLDLARFNEARHLFESVYNRAHQYALDTRDQQLLNQTFLLKHFMAELIAASREGLIHNRNDTR